METRTIKINKDQYLTDVFKDEGYEFNAIPANCILDKTIPGLGATYSEIVAKRNSIIIEPNIPVILGKTEGKKELLAVYEKTTDKQIKTYLANKKIEFKKFLCTPESYIKVRNIAADPEVVVNIYQDYFCLFDECEKITQDIDYRDLIALPIQDFFSFQNKAFVSATPLDVRDKRFVQKGFFKLKIDPQYEYRKDIELIVTNRYDKTVIEKLEELKDSECICVFLNSTNGLNKIINHIEQLGIKDYSAFCSSKSVLKFKDRAIKNSFENLELPLAKYNFFTSRFFSAVDFYVDKKPDIIILTDLNEAKYSRIDPVTNAIQIYGRFRNEFSDGKKFNSLTHITNVDETEIVLSIDDIELYLKEAENVYDALQDRHNNETEYAKKLLLSHDLTKITFSKFLNKDKSKNYFAVDNFYDDERVKGYYLSAENLEAAYFATDHLIPHLEVKNELVGDRQLLRYKRLRSNIESRKLIVEILDSLNDREVESSVIDYAMNEFRKHEIREKAEVANHIIDAYEKLGGEAIRNVDFKKTRIDALLNNFEKEQNHKKMFSLEVRDAINSKLSEHTEYLLADTIDAIKDVFNVYGITAKVNLPTIKKYFGADKLKGKGKEGYILLRKFQPDEEL